MMQELWAVAAIDENLNPTEQYERNEDGSVSTYPRFHEALLAAQEANQDGLEAVAVGNLGSWDLMYPVPLRWVENEIRKMDAEKQAWAAVHAKA